MLSNSCGFSLPWRSAADELRISLLISLLGSSGRVERPAERLSGMEHLAVSYGDWGQCDRKVRTAARQGCKAGALSASKGGPCIMIGLLALACGGSCG